jgi:hypothetical protein
LDRSWASGKAKTAPGARTKFASRTKQVQTGMINENSTAICRGRAINKATCVDIKELNSRSQTNCRTTCVGGQALE